MLSLPDNWDYTLAGLEKICDDGITSIRTAVDELEESGYLSRQRKRNPKGQLGDWAITLDEYLHTAVRVDGKYRLSPMPESTPAAKVTARNLLTGESRTDWVSSGGNVPEFFSAIPLDDHHILVMTQPEPKRWVSDITILPKEGKPFDVLLEVNKPASVGDWMIYQYGYEKALGKMSPWSEMELVYDPWLLPARIGMGLMAIGALLLAWNGAGRRRSIR
jgi:hypothetical protein